jgi:hypothetical protein
VAIKRYLEQLDVCDFGFILDIHREIRDYWTISDSKIDLMGEQFQSPFFVLHSFSEAMNTQKEELPRYWKDSSSNVKKLDRFEILLRVQQQRFELMLVEEGSI